MSNGLSFCIVSAAVSVLACNMDTNLPEQSEASTSEKRVVQSATQALTVDSSCSPEMADKLRRMQTELTDMVWYAADNYENDAWTQWGVYSFNQPNRGQYQQVVDDLWTLTLTLDADRGLGGGIHYDCRPQDSSDCGGTVMARAVTGSDPWLVHICDNFNSLQDVGGAEHGYALQRSALLHEYFHFLGYVDYGYCNCAIDYVWADPSARSPDNYQLFITGVNGVPSACEVFQGGGSC
ncbi:MAG TPA: hypothetical protein VFG30_32360 [Polyangiales bacterium]|nr:hypothetical protein [Polyangiales bacterium]